MIIFLILFSIIGSGILAILIALKYDIKRNPDSWKEENKYET